MTTNPNTARSTEAALAAAEAVVRAQAAEAAAWSEYLTFPVGLVGLPRPTSVTRRLGEARVEFGDAVAAWFGLVYPNTTPPTYVVYSETAGAWVLNPDLHAAAASCRNDLDDAAAVEFASARVAEARSVPVWSVLVADKDLSLVGTYPSAEAACQAVDDAASRDLGAVEFLDCTWEYDHLCRVRLCTDNPDDPSKPAAQATRPDGTTWTAWVVRLGLTTN